MKAQGSLRSLPYRIVQHGSAGVNCEDVFRFTDDSGPWLNGMGYSLPSRANTPLSKGL